MLLFLQLKMVHRGIDRSYNGAHCYKLSPLKPNKKNEFSKDLMKV